MLLLKILSRWQRLNTDFLHFDGKKEKRSLAYLTLNDALTLAQLDVGQNREHYRDNYLNEIQ